MFKPKSWAFIQISIKLYVQGSHTICDFPFKCKGPPAIYDFIIKYHKIPPCCAVMILNVWTDN